MRAPRGQRVAGRYRDRDPALRILLDLQGCQSASRFRGIGRYTLSLAKAIARNAGEHEIWLLLSALFPETVMPLRQEFAGLVPSGRIAVYSAAGPVAEHDPANSARARVAELVREHAIGELNPDVVHIGSLFEGFEENVVTSIGNLPRHALTAVTLYDLIPLLNPIPYLDNPLYRSCYLHKIESLQRADLLLAISESAKREAEAALNISGDRVVNISAAADGKFQPTFLSPQAKEMILSRFSISRPFVLHVGVIEPRKNFDGLIRAYASMPVEIRTEYQLLLIAHGNETARDDLRRLAASLRLSAQDVVVVAHVSDDDLVALYGLCRLFVFPSLHEGFGLPALEAMACGAAVIGSSTSSIPEVIGREDALFDPSSPTAIAETMRHALTDPAFHQSLRDHGLRQAKQFSWDVSARRALGALESLWDGRRALNEATGKDYLYRALISAVAEESAGLSELDLMRTAEAVAANLAPGEHRQLFVDVSALVHSDPKTGIQRVVRSILLELLRTPPKGYVVEPVYGDQRGCFRYARNFTNTFMNRRPSDASAGAISNVVEARRGDVFLGLDLSAHLFPSCTSSLMNFRNLGVEVHFVVYDLIPLLNPEWCDPGVCGHFRHWIGAITELADSLIGISRSVANDMRRWVIENPAKSY